MNIAESPRPQIKPRPQPRHVPLLHNGDQLTRAEFERRYDAMPELKKAELIEGLVFMGSPVRFTEHAQPHSDLNAWMVFYSIYTPGMKVGDNSSVRLDDLNEPQSDLCAIIMPSHGGRVKITDGYIEGGPELVAEISASTVSIDLHKKLNVYRAHGVQEYIVWRTEEAELDWFVLRGNEYERLKPDVQGILKSQVFPGLWLHESALIDGTMADVLQIAQDGIRSAEHLEFAARLAAAAAAAERKSE